jgi:hypothetical protein
MAQDHKLQQQRFELKYLLSGEITRPIRDFVSGYLEPDDYALGRPNLSYPIHSLYLDSDDLTTHYAAVNGSKNRFKLRLRYYDDNPVTPVFFEVKTRMDNCILKRRCGVRREAVPLLVAGQLPAPEQLLSREPRHLAALQRFNWLLLQLNASPKLHIHYLREAWVSPDDNSVRVTFDRNIRAEPFFSDKTVAEFNRPVPIFPEFVVFELKFTTRFPNWFKELVRRFDLMQFSSAKYSEGVELVGEHCFRGHKQVYEWRRPAVAAR